MPKTRLKAEREFDKTAKSFKLPSFDSPEDLERLVAALKAFDDHESYIEDDTDQGFAQQYEEDLIPPDRIFEYYTRQPFNGLVPEDERDEIRVYYPMFELTPEGMIRKVKKRNRRSRKPKNKVKKLADFEQMLKDFEEYENNLMDTPSTTRDNNQQNSNDYYSSIDSAILRIKKSNIIEFIDTPYDSNVDLVIPVEKPAKQQELSNFPIIVNVKFDSKTSSFQVFRLINLILDRIKTSPQQNVIQSFNSTVNWSEINNWMKFFHYKNRFIYNLPFKIPLLKCVNEFNVNTIFIGKNHAAQLGSILSNDIAWNPGEFKIHLFPYIRFSYFLFLWKYLSFIHFYFN